MDNQNNEIKKIYLCWISKKDQILSFHEVESYELMEFETHEQFQDFYYGKSYSGYRVQ